VEWEEELGLGSKKEYYFRGNAVGLCFFSPHRSPLDKLEVTLKREAKFAIHETISDRSKFSNLSQFYLIADDKSSRFSIRATMECNRATMKTLNQPNV
jgi:hypothetical protein